MENIALGMEAAERAHPLRQIHAVQFLKVHLIFLCERRCAIVLVSTTKLVVPDTISQGIVTAAVCAASSDGFSLVNELKRIKLRRLEVLRRERHRVVFYRRLR